MCTILVKQNLKFSLILFKLLQLSYDFWFDADSIVGMYQGVTF